LHATYVSDGPARNRTEFVKDSRFTAATHHLVTAQTLWLSHLFVVSVFCP